MLRDAKEQNLSDWVNRGKDIGGCRERDHLFDRLDRGDYGDFVLSWIALMNDTGPSVDTRLNGGLLDWSSAIGGSVISTGISFILLAFGSGIGLSVVSAAPTWRDSSGWLWLISGLYLIFVALCSFAFGGYAAARLRKPFGTVSDAENEFRDGMHGLVAWALSILVTAVLTLGLGAAVLRTALPSAGAAGPSASSAAESIIASELDRLFWSDSTSGNADLQVHRAEAGRILLKSSSHNGIPAEDRHNLTLLVANEAGISTADAETRVSRVIADAAEELHRARTAAVVEAFLIAAALMVGAAVAWFSATAGGQDRERGAIPVWDWSWRRG